MMLKCFLIACTLAFSLADPAKFESTWGPAVEKHYAGYINSSDVHHHMFFQMFEARASPETAPLVLWLTGGPGCSSQLALLFENGPYKVANNLSLEVNPHSWNNEANVIWLDNPVGAGWSYSDDKKIVDNETEVAADVVGFLHNFIEEFPQFTGRPFFVTGESYAGHYVPSVAKALLDDAKLHPSLGINLQGIAIGNGLVNPAEQYTQYAPYAFYHGIVKQSEYDIMNKFLGICEPLIEACNNKYNTSTGPTTCLSAVATCNLGEVEPVALKGINLYNYKAPCLGSTGLCYDFSNETAVLNSPATQTALNIPKHREWASCNRLVDLLFIELGHDWMRDGFYFDVFDELLTSGKSVLIYAGVLDFICNFYGQSKWVNALQWSGASAFAAAKNETFTVGGVAKGNYRTAQNFTYLEVYDAGHMSPHDQPEAVLEMITNFVHHKPL